MSDMTYQLRSEKDFVVKSLYTGQEKSGIVILIAASAISCVAVLGLLSAISLSAFNTRTSASPHLFVRTHVAAYFMSLMVSDLMQVVGSIMNAKWVHEMAVTYEHFCTIQACIKQAADIGLALWSLIIAVHTFNVLFLRLEVPRVALYVTIVGGWSTVAALVIAGPATSSNQDGPFYGISGYWCWITDLYATKRFVLDYMIMFISALLSFVLYALIFLRLRGILIVEGRHISFRVRPALSGSLGNRMNESYVASVTRRMLLYPIAYTIIILPIAVVRFVEWSGHNVSFSLTIACDTVYLFSGAINAILFSTTRRILPPRSVLGKLAISKPHLIESSSAVESTLAPENDPYYAHAGAYAKKKGAGQLADDEPPMLDSPDPETSSVEHSEYSFDSESTVPHLYPCPAHMPPIRPQRGHEAQTLYSTESAPGISGASHERF
ncbi:hypothetical protein GLOTRDRAFT_137912 [Gloeophyllum trabeum ATCC 11539]|uniref:Uncharacterized protein n=1 Tax=Gloeophyllum trabeum (strain ATCC 11539 / FP-39264 / Madison 617) TaxID=670483 RepID=S7RSK5_GLOTA|nr:uncharacterized protein GLOTRDRAFT_137912 [Gloeophyllum trabeum ATCC 11539]EPQ57650.1 hypothetical protein GLOTRDRAFT_137912 [Gloeophyllum trabeum ATCC 11539]